jgi:hypothetical protein
MTNLKAFGRIYLGQPRAFLDQVECKLCATWPIKTITLNH